MRILHISTAITWRGGENQILLLLEHLQEKCHNILFCPENSALAKRMKSSPIPVITFQKKSGWSLKQALRIKNEAEQSQVDLIHVHDSHAHNYAYLSGLIGSTVPIIVTRRVDFKPSTLGRMKYNYSKVKSIVCVSDHTRAVLEDSGVSTGHLATIHSGVKLIPSEGGQSLNESLGWTENAQVVGFVGALVGHKSPITFLKVARRLIASRPSIKFIMCGVDGEESKAVHEYISHHQLEAKVAVLGFQESLKDIWATLNILLITSEMEGLGTVALEAMHYKVPLVSSNAGGLKEMIGHGVNGFLCNPKDVEAYHDRIIEVLDNESLRLSFIAEGSKKVVHYESAEMGKKYLELYERALKWADND